MLHIATLHGHQKLVSMLIDDGADINAQDGKGRQVVDRLVYMVYFMSGTCTVEK